MEGYGIKGVFFLFNGIFMAFGLVIIAVARVDMGMIKGFDGTKEVTEFGTDAVLIAIGVFIIIITALGCFGAWKESPKLLYICAGCLIVTILLELSAVIAAAALRPQIEGTMKTQLRVSFIKNKSTRDEDFASREFWNRIQSTLKCCGITGHENYYTSEPRINPPVSCCPAQTDDISPEIYRATCITEQQFFKEGCEEKVLSTVHRTGLTVIVCGILFCVLEIAGIILARLCFAKKVSTNENLSLS